MPRAKQRRQGSITRCRAANSVGNKASLDAATKTASARQHRPMARPKQRQTMKRKRNNITDSGGRLNIGLWSQHFLITWTIVDIGAMIGAFKLFSSAEHVRSIPVVWAALFIATGVALFFVQRRKLRFRMLCLTADADRFRAEVRKLMKSSGWAVTRDTGQFLQAVYRVNNQFTPMRELLTLQFDGRAVLYNVIIHPDIWHGAFDSVFSRCRHGRRLIARIMDSQTK
jgi:hypothetical protein